MSCKTHALDERVSGRAVNSANRSHGVGDKREKRGDEERRSRVRRKSVLSNLAITCFIHHDCRCTRVKYWWLDPSGA
jgi:hypothetical protein